MMGGNKQTIIEPSNLRQLFTYKSQSIIENWMRKSLRNVDVWFFTCSIIIFLLQS